MNWTTQVMYGADPEGFFEHNGQIIGSEKVIPRAGLKSGRHQKSCVVLDGVQFELNPPARNNPHLLGAELAISFELLRRRLRRFPEVAFNWSTLVEVHHEELQSLSPECRVLGCKPSLNAYGRKPLTIDPQTYPKRSAGGHLHFGLPLPLLKSDRINLVPLLDIFVGNTCVMLDKDLGAAERRENYGRAGEYRLPKYGLEYRTLSNFWLRSYTLMDLVFGLSQIALSVYENSVMGGEIEDDLINVVNIDNVINAINTNNQDLAQANFNVIVPFIDKHVRKSHTSPVNRATLGKFQTFLNIARRSSIDVLFPEKPEVAWSSKRQDFSLYLSQF